MQKERDRTCLKLLPSSSIVFFLVPLFLGLVAQAVSAPLTAVANSPNSVRLTWTAPGDDANVGTAAGYSIRYSTTVITANNWAQATEVAQPPSPQPAGSQESFDITNLQSVTQYYFAIKAVDEADNWAVISTVVGVTTPESIPPSVIADLAAVNSTETTIELVWTAPGDDSTSGQATVYDARYSTSPITEANWTSATVVSGAPSPSSANSSEVLVVTGLTEETVHYFAIKTADEVPNWSSLSNVASLSTASDQTPPAAVTDLQVASPGP